MAIKGFRYLKATNLTTPPGDSGWKRFEIEPSNYKEFLEFGKPVHNAAGSLQFLARPVVYVTWKSGHKLLSLANGQASSDQTVKAFMQEFRSAQSSTQGMMWFQYYQPTTGTWVSKVGKPRKPDTTSRQTVCPAFAVEIISLGVNSLDYNGGVFEPPDPTDSTSYGDPYYGGYGYGHYSAGVYSVGRRII